MLFRTQTPDNYVLINGVKYTDKEVIIETLETSVGNVKLDLQEMFSDLDLDDLVVVSHRSVYD